MGKKSLFTALSGLFVISSMASFANAYIDDSKGVGEGRSKENLRAFQNIGIEKADLNLDSFQGNIEGVQLQCSKDGQGTQHTEGTIGFCTNENCTNSKSGAGVKVSKEYAEFMENYGYKCFRAMEKHGCVKKAVVCGIGGHAKRTANIGGKSSKTPSRHSTGDAMDITGALKCYDKKDNPWELKFTVEGRAANEDAYDEFVSCWEKQVDYAAFHEPEKYAQGKGGCISCVGSQPPANADHNDHVHISAPVRRQEPLKDI